LLAYCFGVRVLTWNIWWRHGAFEERQAAIEDVLVAEAADVICLQEVWANENGDHQGQLIADRLGCDMATTDGPFFNGWSVNNVVLSRFPITLARTVSLPAADGSPSHRRAVVAHLDTPWGIWPVISTHLEHRFDHSATRSVQAVALLNLVNELRGDPTRDAPVIIGGDLNAVPDSDEIRVLTGRTAAPVPGLVLNDCWEQVGDGPGHTWSGRNPNLPASAWPNRRLDYLMVSWPRPRPFGNPMRAWLAGDAAAVVSPSDHFAVVADFRTDSPAPSTATGTAT
jgi:endonuclease/exonuclease/phosphatase family metal-dependent hydrolase